jgi:hypothetical protein
MPKYKVTQYYTVTGHIDIEIEADSAEAAEEKVREAARYGRYDRQRREGGTEWDDADVEEIE